MAKGHMGTYTQALQRDTHKQMTVTTQSFNTKKVFALVQYWLNFFKTEVNFSSLLELSYAY